MIIVTADQIRDAANDRLIAAMLDMLKTLQFGFNHCRCPVCSGWDVGPNGETDHAHTRGCPVRKVIAQAEGREL